ncbi:MAG: thymidylate kinase [Anaerolineae bacterium]|nr:thymidylate kinase [Anaerolineae bacterium]
MTRMQTYGFPLPGMPREDLPGKLIVIEGTDGVGRSTQVALLREWLEQNGYGAVQSGLARSALASRGINRAKQGHMLSPTTMDLFYATDFADRLEKEIIPALRAGFVMLTDRYIYAPIARALARGANPEWIFDVYGFALVPDAIFYLRADLDAIVPRVLAARGAFDYWESGSDVLPGSDLYVNYGEYQQSVIDQFDLMAERFGFHTVDASQGVHPVFVELKSHISEIVADMKPCT